MSAAAVAPATTSSPPSTSSLISNADTRTSSQALESVAQEARPSASNEAKEDDHSRSNPLPPDLRKILNEVARSGTCPWLPWNSSSSIPAAVASRLSANAVTAAAKGGFSSSSSGSKIHFSARRSASSPYAGSNVPPKKKRRNGMHRSRRIFGADNATKLQQGGRKRPFLLVRPTPATGPNATASAGSVGSSGRTSGSEPDDSTQYECDSEGTSATTNSEISFEGRRDRLLKKQRGGVTTPTLPSSNSNLAPSAQFKEEEEEVSSSRYRTLKEAFRVALGLVLDHWYRHRGGYKLSPAETRKMTLTQNGSDNRSKVTEEQRAKIAPTAERIYQQRRQRLLMMLGRPPDGDASLGTVVPKPKQPVETDGPPFTIQRIAEVLMAPERYYTQTHKLVNCLEKLLLVSSPTSAFGGSTGGDTSQSRREVRELAALANEKERQEYEFRQRRLRRRMSSLSDDLPLDAGADGISARLAGLPNKEEAIGAYAKKGGTSGKKMDGSSAGSQKGGDGSSREMLEAAARASLRSKFDHVGIDPHSSSVANRDVRSIAENRGLTNSPPPPSLAMAAGALQGHGGVAGFVRQHLPEQGGDHSLITRVPSPILFSGSDSMHSNPNMHMLQMHHAAALAGVSVGTSPFDLVTIDAAGSGTTAAHGPAHANPESPDLEAKHDGRSSASNSDVDSESDDVSLDDSASDRSDGSDSGLAYEPFTAARVMALNRMQQQQRLQSRALTSLSSLHQSEGFRPPADSEYQSGDSIDSLMAEDSGGSDSSSSDLAD